jgi:hypothetical protein
MIAGRLALFQGESREGKQIELLHKHKTIAAEAGIWQGKKRQFSGSLL